MAKVKIGYFCQNCGAQHSQWMGQCTHCGTWNTLVEERVEKGQKTAFGGASQASHHGERSKALRLGEIKAESASRLCTRDAEFNRALGGGITAGSVNLLGGEPGIGKSTLLLQLALQLAPHKVLYVSGEESPLQIKRRATRLPFENPHLFLSNETQTRGVFHQLDRVQPDLLIVDSIQSLQTDCIDASPGTVVQLRASTAELVQFSKASNTPVVLIGHITKAGQLAGPKVLEHLVDTVLQFEGDPNHVHRILRVLKNRFGSTSALGVYEMRENGLREVANPSDSLITRKGAQLSGSSIAVTLAGMRPLLIEVQALVSSAVYGTPQRSATGYDAKRLNMLLAVLEKRAGFELGTKDVFLNVTGGIRVTDPALDLAVIAAILSSDSDSCIPENYCFTAEVGLSGELRAVRRVEPRISEAEKLGFKKVFLSPYNHLSQEPKEIEPVRIAKVADLCQALFQF